MVSFLAVLKHNKSNNGPRLNDHFYFDLKPLLTKDFVIFLPCTVAPKQEDDGVDDAGWRNRNRSINLIAQTNTLFTKSSRSESDMRRNRSSHSLSSLGTTRTLKTDISSDEFDKFRNTVSQMKITTHFALKQFILDYGNGHVDDSLSDDDTCSSIGTDDEELWPSRAENVYPGPLSNDNSTEFKEDMEIKAVRRKSNVSFKSDASTGAKKFKKAYRRVSMQTTGSYNSSGSANDSKRDCKKAGRIATLRNALNMSVSTLATEL